MIEPVRAAGGPDGAPPRADLPDAALPGRTAGAMLKLARERQGLHVAVLAATIKVAPAKLDALENDRYDELPNLTFARALAQSVCRSLKIDPRPVLALLPLIESPPLEGNVGKLNTPFHERPSRGDGAAMVWSSKPLFWAGALLLVAAVGVAFLPATLVDPLREVALPASAAARAASAPTDVGPAPAVVVASAPAPAPALSASAAALSPPATPTMAQTQTQAHSQPQSQPRDAVAGPVPASAAAVLPSASAAPAAGTPVAGPVTVTGALQMSATAPSWIEVMDNDGKVLFSRVLQVGEAVGVDGAAPLRVRVGNASGTQLTYRGKAVDLSNYTRVNVARLELR